MGNCIKEKKRHRVGFVGLANPMKEVIMKGTEAGRAGEGAQPAFVITTYMNVHVLGVRYGQLGT
jgi:hypothetical protein